MVVGDVATLGAEKRGTVVELLGHCPHFVHHLGSFALAVHLHGKGGIASAHHIQQNAKTMFGFASLFTLSPDLAAYAPGVGSVVRHVLMLWRATIFGIEKDDVYTQVWCFGL